MALDRRGRLLVTSTGASRISALDPRTGWVLERFGPEEGVVYPEDLAVGPDGAIYWTGFLTGDVGRIEPDGEARDRQRRPGRRPDRLRRGRTALRRALFGVDVAEDGDVLAVDGPALRRIDPATGERSIVATLGFLPDNLRFDDATGRTFVSGVSGAEVVEVAPDGRVRPCRPAASRCPRGWP